MNPSSHRVLTQVFLVANSLFWLPWGLINLIWPESWAGEVIPNYKSAVTSPSVVCLDRIRSSSSKDYWDELLIDP